MKKCTIIIALLSAMGISALLLLIFPQKEIWECLCVIAAVEAGTLLGIFLKKIIPGYYKGIKAQLKFMEPEA